MPHESHRVYLADSPYAVLAAVGVAPNSPAIQVHKAIFHPVPATVERTALSRAWNVLRRSESRLEEDFFLYRDNSALTGEGRSGQP